MAELLGIWVKRAHRGRMDAVPSATLVAGRGLHGDATQGGRRQITIMSRQHWTALTAHLPGPPPPALRRANLLVDDLDLRGARRRVLRIGDARVRIFGETRPCRQMDDACPGLQAALAPPWGGGAFGEVLSSGTIRVGGPVEWEPEDVTTALTRGADVQPSLF